MAKKKYKIVITKEEILKMWKKVLRETMPSTPTKIHKTHKKDKKRKNDVKKHEIDQL